VHAVAALIYVTIGAFVLASGGMDVLARTFR
jgi:hypothetical protein